MSYERTMVNWGVCGLTWFLKTYSLPPPFGARNVEVFISQYTTVSTRLFEYSINSYGKLEQQMNIYFSRKRWESFSLQKGKVSFYKNCPEHLLQNNPTTSLYRGWGFISTQHGINLILKNQIRNSCNSFINLV